MNADYDCVTRAARDNDDNDTHIEVSKCEDADHTLSSEAAER